MRLYHGTDVKINKPDLSFSKDHKDFGRGFYMSQNSRMAKDWAKLHDRNNAHVNTYDVSLEKIGSCTLRIKRFASATAEWVEFVYSNRQRKDFSHTYDIVIGPIADNGLNEIFNDIRQKRLSYSSAAKELQLQGYKKPIQYCFNTPEAISLLKFESYE